MNNLTKVYAVFYVRELFLSILISFLITVIVWLFATVVTSMLERDFADIWVVAFPAILFTLWAIDTVSFISVYAFIHYSLMPRGLSYEDSFDAYITYELHKVLPISEWTPLWVQIQVQDRRMAEAAKKRRFF